LGIRVWLETNIIPRHNRDPVLRFCTISPPLGFRRMHEFKLGDIMDIQKLKTFFMWCTIINGALLVVSIMIFVSAPDFMYSMQSQLFPMPRETFNVVLYSFLGLFKIFFLVFNAVPYGALLIVQKNATTSPA
jgi:hypothetical protein